MVEFAVNDDGTVTLNEVPTLGDNSSTNSSQSFTPRTTLRSVNTYNDIDECILGDTNIFRPTQMNNPLFDSFFLQKTENTIIIWVLQMTIAKQHGGAKKGFDILTKLRKRVKEKYSSMTVEMQYVLVVPYKCSGVAVQWNMSQGWKDLEGGVSALYLEFADIPYDRLVRST